MIFDKTKLLEIFDQTVEKNPCRSGWPDMSGPAGPTGKRFDRPCEIRHAVACKEFGAFLDFGLQILVRLPKLHACPQSTFFPLAASVLSPVTILVLCG